VPETPSLPDLNVLVAAHIEAHPHHAVAWSWLTSIPAFATCSITETGLIRLMSLPGMLPDFTPNDGLTVLRRLRALPSHTFWADDSTLAAPLIDATRLIGHKRITDFHLLNLAASRGSVLVTLDAKITRSLARTDRKYVVTLTDH